MLWHVLGSVGQWLGCILLGVGIGVEIAARAEIGYIILTGGAIVFTVATKYKELAERRELKRLRDGEDKTK